ncbi:MAG: hypothetical protein IT285_16240 [Bdellovibrionales bacterium]|nr:hypothetical protein [Bdellovibrionales bacterium]
MAVTDAEQEYRRLRSYLNPYFRGRGHEDVLRVLAASSSSYLVNNVSAISDQLYMASASGRYLDERAADSGLIRPPAVGLSDETFREIGIEVVNRKQVRDLVHNLLDKIFGPEYVRATSASGALEPYQLQDGDTLLLQFDDGDVAEVRFSTSQFQSIAAAKAQEVADAITRGLRALGRTGSAFARDDGLGPRVVLMSDTLGPSSTVTVRGGSAQNRLVFPSPRPAGGAASTQWTVTLVSGGAARFTWTGGASPSLGRVRRGDYVNIYGPAFSSGNRGTFEVTSAEGGTSGSAYFEVSNPIAAAQVVVQGTTDALLFYRPTRSTLWGRRSYAAAFQAEARLLEVFVPATTRVVRRSRIGAAHLHGELGREVTTVTVEGANEIADVTCPPKASIADGAHFLYDTPDEQYYFYFDTTGGDLVDPAPPGRTPVRVDVSGATTAAQVAEALSSAARGLADVSSAPPGSAVARLVCLDVGTAPDAANVDVVGLSVSVVQQGQDHVESVSLVDDLYADLGAPDQPGPYVYDQSQPFVLSSVGTVLSADLDSASGRVASVANASGFPDAMGHLVLGYGTKRQEGPVPYLSRPGSSALILSPAYTLRNRHPAGTDVALVASRAPVSIDKAGRDYPLYVTDVVSGRAYAEDLINEVAATGIRVLVTVLYPSDEGLGKWGTEHSDVERVFGE